MAGAAYLKERLVIFKEERVGGRARVTIDEKQHSNCTSVCLCLYACVRLYCMLASPALSGCRIAMNNVKITDKCLLVVTANLRLH